MSAARACEWGLALAAGALLAVPLPVLSPARRATIPVLLVAGAVALARRAGGAGVLRVAAISGATGLALELMAIRAGTFAQRSPELLWTFVPVAWAAFAFPVVALAVSARHPLRRSAGAAAALVALALLWDPLGMQAGFFTWPGGGSFATGVVGFDGSRGIPPGSFAGWAIVAACAQWGARGAARAAAAENPPLPPLLWAALAWRTLHADIEGVLLPSLAAGAAALVLTRVAPERATLRSAPPLPHGL